MDEAEFKSFKNKQDIIEATNELENMNYFE